MSASFATTRWTMVLAAGRAAATDDTVARAALGELCSAYREPLVAHARRRGLRTADAEDAVQEFFARLLRLESLATVRRERGRFRSFLLGAFNHHLADLHDRERAAKRGGDRVVRLDTAAWEASAPASAERAPDAAFDRAWAVALLGRVLERLRVEHEAAGRREWFETLAPCLAGRTSEGPQADVAARLGMSEAAVRVAVHRLRKRYRDVLREEVAQTVGGPAEVEAELRHLLAAVRE